jgi:hypothetical protein
VTKNLVVQDKKSFLCHSSDRSITAEAKNAHIALPHKLRPYDRWTDGRSGKCQQCCSSRYRHSEPAAAVPLPKPPLKLTPYFFDVTGENNQEDSDLMNDLDKLLIPTFLCRQC